MLPEQTHTEAPLSIHIDGYYKGFHIGITVRQEDNTTLPLTRVVSTVNSLVELGFEPSWNTDTNKNFIPKVPAQERTVDLSIDGEQGQGGTCPVHGSKLVWKTGISKKDNNPYAFWSCPTKNADGSYCKAATQKTK